MIPFVQIHFQHVFTSRAIEAINDHASMSPEKPFFLYLAYQQAHTPLQVPEEYLDLIPSSVKDEDRRAYLGNYSQSLENTELFM